MGLVLARHRRPVTRIRHAGGFFFTKLMVISENWSSGRWETRSPCCCRRSPRHRLSSSAVPFVFTPSLSASCGPNGSGAAVTSSGGLSDRGPVPETSPPRRVVWCVIPFTQRQRHFSLAKQTLLVACVPVWASESLVLRSSAARYLQLLTAAKKSAKLTI